MRPLTVDYAVYTQALTKKPVKGMLTGPVTMLNWSFPRIDISLAETTLQLALAIKDEVLDLEDHGIKIIQIDEAALREKLPCSTSVNRSVLKNTGQYSPASLPSSRPTPKAVYCGRPSFRSSI